MTPARSPPPTTPCPSSFLAFLRVSAALLMLRLLLVLFKLDASHLHSCWKSAKEAHGVLLCLEIFLSLWGEKSSKKERKTSDFNTTTSFDKQKKIWSERNQKKEGAIFFLSLGLKNVFKSSETPPTGIRYSNLFAAEGAPAERFRMFGSCGWTRWRLDAAMFVGTFVPIENSLNEPEPKWQRVYVNGTESGSVAQNGESCTLLLSCNLTNYETLSTG